MGNSKSMSQDISSNQESSTAQSPSDNAVMAQMHKPIMANFASGFSDHKPRILLLYGSLRERSYSRLGGCSSTLVQKPKSLTLVDCRSQILKMTLIQK